jgi:hypothetical protein
VQSPSKSLLLQKPLAEFQGGVPHGGHDKFVLEGDGGYRAFLYFVERYASCKIGSEFEFSAGGSSGE